MLPTPEASPPVESACTVLSKLPTRQALRCGVCKCLHIAQGCIGRLGPNSSGPNVQYCILASVPRSGLVALCLRVARAALLWWFVGRLRFGPPLFRAGWACCRAVVLACCGRAALVRSCPHAPPRRRDLARLSALLPAALRRVLRPVRRSAALLCRRGPGASPPVLSSSGSGRRGVRLGPPGWGCLSLLLPAVSRCVPLFGRGALRGGSYGRSPFLPAVSRVPLPRRYRGAALFPMPSASCFASPFSGADASGHTGRGINSNPLPPITGSSSLTAAAVPWYSYSSSSLSQKVLQAFSRRLRPPSGACCCH